MNPKRIPIEPRTKNDTNLQHLLRRARKCVCKSHASEIKDCWTLSAHASSAQGSQKHATWKASLNISALKIKRKQEQRIVNEQHKTQDCTKWMTASVLNKNRWGLRIGSTPNKILRNLHNWSNGSPGGSKIIQDHDSDFAKSNEYDANPRNPYPAQKFHLIIRFAYFSNLLYWCSKLGVATRPPFIIIGHYDLLTLKFYQHNRPRGNFKKKQKYMHNGPDGNSKK